MDLHQLGPIGEGLFFIGEFDDEFLQVLGLCGQQDLIIALYMLDSGSVLLKEPLEEGLIHKVQLQRISFLNDLRKSVHGHMVVVVEFHFYGHFVQRINAVGNSQAICVQFPVKLHQIHSMEFKAIYSDLTLFSRIEQGLVVSDDPIGGFLCTLSASMLVRTSVHGAGKSMPDGILMRSPSIEYSLLISWLLNAGPMMYTLSELSTDR